MTTSLRAAGTTTGTTAAVTAINPSPPAGWQSGDISIMYVAIRDDTAGIPTSISGWTHLFTATGGSGAFAADAGTSRIAVFYREDSPAAPGNIAFTSVPANASACAVIHIYQKTGSAWDISKYTSVADNTQSSNYNATVGGIDLEMTAADRLLFCEMFSSDGGSVTAESITVPGMVMNNLVIRAERAVSTGNDSRLRSGDHTITSGTSTGPPQHAYTNLQGGTGLTAFVRLREVPALVVADATHAQATDNLTLTQTHVLTVADAAHSQAADSLTLTQVHNLVIADSTHSQAADSLALVQANNLVVADSTHAQAVDSLTLTQTHMLAIADSTHSQAADNLALTQNSSLVIADSTHSHSADNLALAQTHVLVIADSEHAQTADSLTLVPGGSLAVADSTHSHTADNLTLTQTHVLVIADSTHAQTADSLTLTQTHVLAVSGNHHDQTADSLTLTQTHVLAIADSTHAHAADSPTLVQSHVLVIADALHGHTADNVALVNAREMSTTVVRVKPRYAATLKAARYAATRAPSRYAARRR